MKKYFIPVIAITISLVFMSHKPNEVQNCQFNYVNRIVRVKANDGLCHHQITLNGEKFTIIDNGCKETQKSISEAIKAGNCSLDYVNFQRGW